MPIDIEPPRISSEETPREILKADFRSIRELPIRGGWGYTIDDAVVIDKNDPIVPRGMPFDGVGIEYVFVEKRIYEELIVFRPKDARHSGIEWKLLKQATLGRDGRSFDFLSFEVTAFPDKDWEELRLEFEGPRGARSPGFDMAAHRLKREAKKIRYVAEYYFDITSLF